MYILNFPNYVDREFINSGAEHVLDNASKAITNLKNSEAAMTIFNTYNKISSDIKNGEFSAKELIHQSGLENAAIHSMFNVAEIGMAIVAKNVLIDMAANSAFYGCTTAGLVATGAALSAYYEYTKPAVEEKTVAPASAKESVVAKEASASEKESTSVETSISVK